MEIINTRRFFRNRFEYYVDNKDSSCVGVCDETQLSVLDVCELLEHDQEPFPRRYDVHMRKLCGHECLTWFQEERTYGDVARLLKRKVAREDGRTPC
ncbi:UNVERIFIED_ORG: hypothetical protein GGD47_001947 [Rhizobium etli]